MVEENKPFACSQCNKRFTRKSNLKAHERTHTDDRPFECTTCRKTFRRQHDLKVHEQQHSKVKNMMTCHGTLDSGLPWGCGKSFDGPTKLMRHFWNKTGRNCVKALWDQEAEKPQQSTAMSIPSFQTFRETLQGEDIEQSLPPIILDHIPDLAGVDVEEEFRAEGPREGSSKKLPAVSTASSPTGPTDQGSASKRDFDGTLARELPSAGNGIGAAVPPLDKWKRRRLSL